MGLQVGEELIQRKTFKIRRAPQVWGKMMNSLSSLLSLEAPGKYSKRSLTVTHTSHLLPAVVSLLWVDFRADTWTHEPRSEPSTPVCLEDMPPHMTLGWSTGGFPHSSVGKESACNAGDHGWIPGSGRPTEEGIGYPLQYTWSSLVAQLVKNQLVKRETQVWSLSWGESPGEGKDYPLQYSGLEDSMDCIVHGVAKSQTRVSDFHFHFL